MQRNSQKESRAMSQASVGNNTNSKSQNKHHYLLYYILYSSSHWLETSRNLYSSTCLHKAIWCFFVGGCQHHSAMQSHPRDLVGQITECFETSVSWVWLISTQLAMGPCVSPTDTPKKKRWKLNDVFQTDDSFQKKKRGPVHILLPDKKKKKTHFLVNTKNWESVFQFTSFSPHLVGTS